MQTYYTTQRLSLSELTLNDAEFIAALVNTAEWIRFIGERNIKSKEDAVAYIQKIIDNPNVHYWVVSIKEGEVPVGVVTFIKRNYLTHHDIGFAFLPESSGHGYAYEATKGLLNMIRTKVENDPVLAITLPGNINSIKLLTKLGLHFQKEHLDGEEKLHIYTT